MCASPLERASAGATMFAIMDQTMKGNLFTACVVIPVVGAVGQYSHFPKVREVARGILSTSLSIAPGAAVWYALHHATGSSFEGKVMTMAASMAVSYTVHKVLLAIGERNEARPYAQ